MIRVSGGKYRSRQLLVADEVTIPTKARVREAIMSMAAPFLKDAVALDLFAGSGALGIEALSRGAAKAIFVEKNPTAQNVISKNLSSLKENNGSLFKTDAISFLKTWNRDKFDVVFLDPPYAEKHLYSDSLSIMIDRELMSPGAVIFIEYEGDLVIDDSPFSFRKDYTYGLSKVIQLRF